MGGPTEISPLYEIACEYIDSEEYEQEETSPGLQD